MRLLPTNQTIINASRACSKFIESCASKVAQSCQSTANRIEAFRENCFERLGLNALGARLSTFFNSQFPNHKIISATRALESAPSAALNGLRQLPSAAFNGIKSVSSRVLSAAGTVALLPLSLVGRVVAIDVDMNNLDL